MTATMIETTRCDCGVAVLIVARLAPRGEPHPVRRLPAVVEPGRLNVLIGCVAVPDDPTGDAFVVSQTTTLAELRDHTVHPSHYGCRRWRSE